MKNRTKQIMAAFAAAAVVMGSLAGCGGTTSDSTASNESAASEAKSAADTASPTDTASSGSSASASAQSDEDVSGSVSMAGSTSMEKLANAMQEAIMEKYPKLTVTAEFTGSSAGIESLEAGSVDIGNASRSLSDDEKAQGIVENIVAIDGIAIITDKNNKLTDITTDQLKQVYTGEVTNWKDVGGSDQAIVAVGREAGSGTRSAFEELVGVEDQCKYANELDSTGAVMAKVAATPGAIGYVSLDVIDDSVNTLKVNGVEASEDTILSGDYQLQRPFIMATKGEISEQSDAVQAYFRFVQSDEGKNVIESVGLIVPEGK